MMDLLCVDVARALGWWVLNCWISDYMTCRLGTLAKVYSGLRSLATYYWYKLYCKKSYRLHFINKSHI